jgi:hypothetical protein
MKRLPIEAAKALAKKYNQAQVILVTWDALDHVIHTVSYGKTTDDCAQAALGANLVRETLGFPEEDCHEVPYRARDKLPEVDWRVEFEKAEPMECRCIPPGKSYGKKVFGDVTVVVVRARTLTEALQTAEGIRASG